MTRITVRDFLIPMVFAVFAAMLVLWLGELGGAASCTPPRIAAPLAEHP